MIRFLVKTFVAVFVVVPMLIVVTLAGIAAFGSGEVAKCKNVTVYYQNETERTNAERLAEEMSSDLMFGTFNRECRYHYWEDKDGICLTMSGKLDKPMNAESVGAFQALATILSQKTIDSRPLRFEFPQESKKNVVAKSRDDLGKFWTNGRDQIFFDSQFTESETEAYLQQMKEARLLEVENPLFIRVSVIRNQVNYLLVGNEDSLRVMDDAERNEMGSDLANYLSQNVFNGRETVFGYATAGLEPMRDWSWSSAEIATQP